MLLGSLLLICAVAAVGFVALSRAGSPTTTPSASPMPTASRTPTPIPTALTHTVTGSFVLTDTSVDLAGITAIGGQCQGTDGYSDLGPGTPVTLKDENGTILADASLSLGTGTSSQCTFTFTLTGVPDTARFYSVEVGRRGAITDSHDELQAAGWMFSLSMGS